MKNRYLIIFFLITMATGIFLVSCDSYLDAKVNNTLSMEETFSKRLLTQSYLAQVYSFLPADDGGGISANTGSGLSVILGDMSVVPRSDEAQFSWQYGVWEAYRHGNYGVSSTNYHKWIYDYIGIKQASIFISNVDNCKEVSEEERGQMKAEARFIRAYLYFDLFRVYGPVYIWGDKDSDPIVDRVDPGKIDRNTVQENLDFILSEYDKAILDLPLNIGDERNWDGRITKGAVMAAKSRLTLYAARPLFNGCDLYKGKMKNLYGKYLFPQTSDPKKWEDAATAAKDVIDLGVYSLYEDDDTKETDPFRHAIKSYMGVFFKFWNKECIWSKYNLYPWDWEVRTLPTKILGPGVAGYAPSLKLVDTYPMAVSGRFPVTGYNSDGSPIIDPQSGFNNTGFTNGYIHPLDNFAPINAHNSCIGRDARFYASVLANGMNWINQYSGVKLVTFYKNGTSNYSETEDCARSGFLWRRMTDPANDYAKGQWGAMCWPVYRMAEIYLNYAEACNEKTNRDESEALKYVNLVRARSGLNKMEVAYPEVIGNQELLRSLLRKERMVELAFEGHRFYDVRTWMIAEQESNQPSWTLNVAASTYAASWERTDQIIKDRLVFDSKQYFLPIQEAQLSEMKNITQNYGW